MELKFNDTKGVAEGSRDIFLPFSVATLDDQLALLSLYSRAPAVSTSVYCWMATLTNDKLIRLFEVVISRHRVGIVDDRYLAEIIDAMLTIHASQHNMHDHSACIAKRITEYVEKRI